VNAPKSVTCAFEPGFMLAAGEAVIACVHAGFEQRQLSGLRAECEMAPELLRTGIM
jgi:hypothetical protein